ncbi:MAG TPA: dienelactone hydrolase family protein [Terriglobales bacterium]|jgi:hypothetical protein|nr:dienelactone hydrolase family protein [Terriglobales bacterium]
MNKVVHARPDFQIIFFILAATFISPLLGHAQEPSEQAPSAQSDSKSSPTNLSSADLTPKVMEDFSTPALTSTTALGSIESLKLTDDVDAQFTREVTRVQWRPADPIDLYIVKPAGVKNPPVILYLFDYPTENDHYLNREFCRLLTQQGFAAVGFVPALTGQRYHDRPMKEWFVSELRESLATSAHDVQMALNYLATREDVDMDRVGMFGDGSGASIAILAAAVEPRIKTLDLVDPWGDWPDWMANSTRVPENERPAFVKPEWLVGVAPLDPVQWLPKLKTQKVRIQFVKTVGVTPVEAQEKIEAAAPANAQIVHYEDSVAFAKYNSGGKGFDWIKQQMQAAPTQQYRAAGDRKNSQQ